MSRWCTIEHSAGDTTVVPRGSWRLHNLQEIADSLSELEPPKGQRLLLDGRQLEELDTSGAMLLLRFLFKEGRNESPVRYGNVQEAHRSILELVSAALEPPLPLKAPDTLGFVGEIGKATFELGRTIYGIIEFVGEAAIETGKVLRRPGRLRLKEFAVQLEQTGLDAVPIVILVNALIGVVIAYLAGVQTEKYGANIFVVDGIALTTCRELSPILVAIIVAGRSGSAFTAQIGAMKLNEEIDAILMLGLSPLRVLVMPRLLALVVVMPLLVFVGDLAGLLGGMFIADLRLDITGSTFIERLHTVLKTKHVLVGLAKAPAFAFFIATIACRLGLMVEENARSVGINTTRTVVRSIVAVILLNAGFAVLLSELGI